MKSKKLVLVSIGLVLVLVASAVLAACAPAAPTPGAPTRITPQVPGQKQQAPVTVTPAKPAPAKPAPAPEAEVFKWRAQQVTPRGASSFVMHEEFYDRLREMSNGRIDITAYAAGEIVTSADTLDGLRKGLIDYAEGGGGYWFGEVPVGSIEYGLPYSFANGFEGYNFTWRWGFMEILEREYAKVGIFPVGPLIQHGFDIMSTRAVRTVEDLKGLKIRTPGAAGEVMTAAGAAVTWLPGPEIYPALSSGVIEACTWGSVADAWDMKFHEVAKYVCMPSVLSSSFMGNYTSLENWNSLSPDLQMILREAVRLLGLHFHTLNYDRDIERMKRMVEEWGLEVVWLPDSEIAKLQQIAKPVWEEIAARDAASTEAYNLMIDYMRFLGYITD